MTLAEIGFHILCAEDELFWHLQHGKSSYPTFEEAAADVRRLKAQLAPFVAAAPVALLWKGLPLQIFPPMKTPQPKESMIK